MNIEEVEEPETTVNYDAKPVHAHRGQAESRRISTWKKLKSRKVRYLLRILSATSDLNPGLLPLP